MLAQRAGIPASRVVKLNANENPYGPSPKVRAALGSLERVHIYPDPRQTAMREAIASYARARPEQIVVGNGSDELIDLLFRAVLAPGDTVVNCTPTFGMYAFTAQVCGGTTVNVARDDRFQVDVPGVLQAVELSQARVVVLASPNNPTGNSVPQAAVERLLAQGLLVILDEAYREFGGESAVAMATTHPRLVVLRTMSKWAGLAGLRVGYGVMAPDLAAVLLRAKPPYNVSQAAETALLASLEDLILLQERVGRVVAERERMRALLQARPDVEVWPSEANFLLCQLGVGTGRKAYEGLARHGVFVRYFSHPRLADCLRISVGTPAETDRLMEALEQVLT